MKKLLRSIFILTSVFISQWVGGQHLVSATYTSTTPASQFGLLTPAAKYDVEHYKILYNTTDVDGSPTVASGALLIPKTSCNSLPLMVFEHGTVLKKTDVPSTGGLYAIIEGAFASTGAISVGPDFLGLGVNPGLHPYLHGESEATASIDLMRAAREFLADSTGITLNGEVYVSGYSQGGHAAMATVKYIQDNNLLSEFNIIGAGPASGPYYLSGPQQKVIISDAPYSNPGYVVYLFLAMNRVYGNLFQNYSEILKSPYDTLIPPYFDGTYDMSTVNALLPDTISGFIQDSVLTNFKNDSVAKNHPLWQALVANDNHDWNPSFPMELYYCTQDEQVVFQNAITAAAIMSSYGANVQAVFKGALDHGNCVLPAMQGALNLFMTLRTDCNAVGIDEVNAADISIYPNPAKNYIMFSGAELVKQVEVFGPNGQVIFKGSIPAQGRVSVGSWARGAYLIKVLTAKGYSTQTLILD